MLFYLGLIQKENLSESVKIFTIAEEMLDSGMLDACMVETPHYAHPHYAMECMKRGIHVMIDKPAGVYTKQVREMNECAAKHPVNVLFLLQMVEEKWSLNPTSATYLLN